MSSITSSAYLFVSLCNNYYIIILLFPIVLNVGWLYFSQRRNPLNKYPGPRLARWTNLWRLWHVTRGDSHVRWKQLHEQYGPTVRVGPNILDLDTPELVKEIYNNFDGEWQKTSFYHGSYSIVNGKRRYNIFSETDYTKHKLLRLPVERIYSMSSILLHESRIDHTIEALCSRLSTLYAENNTTCDLGEWLLFFACDTIGSTTFSESCGYLQHGYDHDGTLAVARKAIASFNIVSQIPWLNSVFGIAAMFRTLTNSSDFRRVFETAKHHVRLRHKQPELGNKSLSRTDILDDLIQYKSKDGHRLDDPTLVSYIVTNMIAGGESTAITLRAIMYFVLKTPRVQKRLEMELLQVDNPAIMSYKAASCLPYLQAVVQESCRVWPIGATTMERYVPSTGLALSDGSVIPAGTIVGVNPWVVNRTKNSVWGPDPETFMPERWLRQDHESQATYYARLQRMRDCDLSFGMGSHSCIGKNLAKMEVFKVIATLFRQFDIRLADPEKDWKINAQFFNMQSSFKVDIKAR